MKPLRDEIALIIANFTGLHPECFTVAVASQKIVGLIRKRAEEAYGFSYDEVLGKQRILVTRPVETPP